MNVGEIVEALTLLEKSEKNTFKKRAFKTAIASITSSNIKKIETSEELKDLPGVGKGILERIDKIISGSFEKPPSIDELLEVHGIGPVKAIELAQKYKITTIKQLQEQVAKDDTLLNDKQKLGLKYVKNTLERIPRKEMTQHNNFIKRNIKKVLKEKYPEIGEDNIEVEITGSYRRKKQSSGDIDVLIKNTPNNTIKLKDIIEILVDKKYLLEENFAYGDVKYLGLAKHKLFDTIRRIDILLISEEEFPFALLYFTGSKEFNIKCRNAALEKGYTLNEHGIVHLETKEKVKGLKTEKDILKFIGIAYVLPEKR